MVCSTAIWLKEGKSHKLAHSTYEVTDERQSVGFDIAKDFVVEMSTCTVSRLCSEAHAWWASR